MTEWHSTCPPPIEIGVATEAIVQGLTITADAELRQSAPDTNYNTATLISVNTASQRAVLRFDTSVVIPQTATVTSAVLSTTLSNACPIGTQVEARRLTQAWTPSAATWNCTNDTNTATAGCQGGSAWTAVSSLPLAGIGVCDGTTALRIDVTSDVASWVATPGAHHGWALRFMSGNNAFSSRETAQGPTLVVNYFNGTFTPSQPIAPPLDRTTPTNTYDQYRFIFDPSVGSSPSNPQISVTPGAITRDRAAHLRGRVVLDSGAGLTGATIELRGHPQLGRTYSRAVGVTDAVAGIWDMVINGGGDYTLVVRQAGYLEVHRDIHVEWGDDLAVPNIVMTAEPNACSAVVSGSTGGFLTGTQICNAGNCGALSGNGWATTDSRGDRSFGLYVPPGASVSSGGTPTSSYRVCISEYTRGVSGTNRQNSMPAEIAANTVYTV